MGNGARCGSVRMPMMVSLLSLLVPLCSCFVTLGGRTLIVISRGATSSMAAQWHGEPRDSYRSSGREGNGDRIDRRGGSFDRGGEQSAGFADRTVGRTSYRATGYVRREHDYADVDVTAVEALIDERTMMRRAHNFAAADALRDRLTEEHGVTVYDRDNEWFFGGGFSRGGSSRGEDRPGGGRLSDYGRDPDDFVDVDVGAVEAMLDERSRFRERRMWDEADMVRKRLQVLHGVTVSDKESEWRVGIGDGRRDVRQERQQRPSFGDKGPCEDEPWGEGPVDVGPMPVAVRIQTEYGIVGHDYSRVAADGTPFSADDFETFNGLMAARLDAKQSHQYDKADALKAMISDLGVTVSDSARIWRADGVSFGRKVWTRIAGDGDVAGTEPTDRYAVRRDDGSNTVAGDNAFGGDESDESSGGAASSPSADELRALTVPRLKELLKEVGRKVGGKKDELIGRLIEAQEQSQLVPKAADPSSGAVVDDVRGMGFDEGAVVALLDLWSKAKVVKDYETADRIAGTLRSVHAVVLDDKRRVWCVVTEYGGYFRVGQQVDPSTTERVGAMLEQRSRHQELKEYAEADALHHALTEMGIVLDTRLKTWKRRISRVGVPGRCY